MLFNSIVFIFAFLPITYAVFWKLKSKSGRYIWLTITGYVFYGWWNPKFCLLMLFSTLVSYTAGIYILDAKTKKAKKVALLISLVTDLALLGFFKYYNFLAGNLDFLATKVGASVHFPHLNIILPVGISFYTFHTMSYIIDSYRGTIKPTRNFFEFSCYVSLFSQLVAGPIVRFRQIEDDLEKIDRTGRKTKLEEGISYFLVGFFKKVLIADSIAAIIDPGFLHLDSMGSGGAWLLALGYTYQLYFDFSGYSDMAVGLGYLFGIRIPQNFNSPYKAINISDFWRRWHISLSSWLRDYLYIGLGGNRKGSVRKKVNLMITMLLGGLWHGANWTFVIWGALHGFYLIIHHGFSSLVKVQIPVLFSQALTFFAVVVGWVFFRCPTLSMAQTMLSKMFSLTRGDFPVYENSLLIFLLLAAGLAHLSPNSTEMKHKYKGLASIGFACLFAVCLFRVMSNENTPFLYFQF